MLSFVVASIDRVWMAAGGVEMGSAGSKQQHDNVQRG
jgi:hypothetical protein